MVRYVDPEEHPELEPPRKRARQSPAERLQRLRERNATLEGVEAIEAAREVALRQLDRRSRSRAELRNSITSRGFSEQIADEVIDRLERVGLVNDTEFAAMFVRERFRTSGKVGQALIVDLQRKGLAQEDIDRALAQVDADDHYQRARELVDGKKRSLRGMDRDKAYRRLTSMLARKGYSPSVMHRVVHDFLEGENDHE